MSSTQDGLALQHSAAARTARAALLRAVQQPLQIEDIEVRAPQGDEVLVRLAGTGICHTDLVVCGGFPAPLPIVLGHEGAGVVEAVGPAVTAVAPGDHVVLSFDACGACPNCAEHQPAYCHQFMPLNFAGQSPEDGSTGLSQGGEKVYGRFFGQSSFATLALARERNTVKVDRDLPLALLGPLGCGVQTGAGAVLNSLKLRAGDGLAVFGGGAVGLSAVMAARAAGAAHIVVVEPHAARRALALELGATAVIDPTAEADVPAAVKAASGGGVPRALDTTGIPPVIRQAAEVLLPNGLLGLLGVSPPEADLPVNVMGMLMRGIGVKAILEGDSDPQRFIPELLALYRAGRFPFDKLIKTFGFEQINEAMAASVDGSVVKPVVVF